MKSILEKLNENVWYINEGELNASQLEFIGNYLKHSLKIYKKEELFDTSLPVNIILGNSESLPRNIKNKIIKNSAGFIIEGYVANVFDKMMSNEDNNDVSIRYNNNKDLFDFSGSANGKDFSLEVKAYTREGNITLTKPQIENLKSSSSNAYYILVKYSLNEDSISFDGLTLLDANLVKRALDNDSKHLSVSELNKGIKLY